MSDNNMLYKIYEPKKQLLTAEMDDRRQQNSYERTPYIAYSDHPSADYLNDNEEDEANYTGFSLQVTIEKSEGSTSSLYREAESEQERRWQTSHPPDDNHNSLNPDFSSSYQQPHTDVSTQNSFTFLYNEQDVPNSSSNLFEAVPQNQTMYINFEEFKYLVTAVNLARSSLSQHVRIEALSTTITLCKNYFGLGINSPQKMLCTFSGAFSLMGTLSLTNNIEKYLGPVAEGLFDLAAMGGVYALSVYAPLQYVNKFSQCSLFTGVAGGQIIRHGLTQVFGPIQPAATIFHLATNDLTVSLLSVGGSNYIANHITQGYTCDFFDYAQASYRFMDIPLNFGYTIITNACSGVVSSLLAVSAFIARIKTHDFMPGKSPLEVVAIALGLLIGGAVFTSLPWWISSEEPPASVVPEASSKPTFGEASDLYFDEEL